MGSINVNVNVDIKVSVNGLKSINSARVVKLVRGCGMHGYLYKCMPLKLPGSSFSLPGG